MNHTLLLLDAVLDGYLLPKHDVIVVDEAHHLEEEATRAFTVTVSEVQNICIVGTTKTQTTQQGRPTRRSKTNHEVCVG